MTPNPHGRRWLRFRLRTLLILIAVLAAPLAWVSQEQRQSRRERQIAKQFLQVSAKIHMGGPYDLPEWHDQGHWRNLARMVLGERVFSVSNLSESAADPALAFEFQSLRRLELLNIQLSDWSPLARLRQL